MGLADLFEFRTEKNPWITDIDNVWNRIIERLKEECRFRNGRIEEKEDEIVCYLPSKKAFYIYAKATGYDRDRRINVGLDDGWIPKFLEIDIKGDLVDIELDVPRGGSQYHAWHAGSEYTVSRRLMLRKIAVKKQKSRWREGVGKIVLSVE